MIKQYREALSFAGILDKANYKDLVHDTYILWMNKTGRSIFEEHQGTMVQAIRYTFLGKYMTLRKSFMYQGVRYPRVHTEFDDFKVPKNENNPEQQYILKEYLTNIENSLTKDEKIVYNYTSKGYRISDIQETGIKIRRMYELQASAKNKINKILMREYEPHNPFNGNRAKVLKVIKRAIYEKTKDKYQEFVYNTDNWADSNEHYMLLTNDNAEGLLILEKVKD